MDERRLGRNNREKERGRKGSALKSLKYAVGTSLVVAAMSLGCNYFLHSQTSEPSKVLQLPDVRRDIGTPIPARPFTQTVQAASGDFDMGYLNEVLAALETPKNIGVEAKLKSITDNLVFMSAGETSGLGLQIDESGYFITVGHNYIEGVNTHLASVSIDKDPEVYNPRSGLVHPAKWVGFNYEEDFAVVFAPTGRPRTPVANMQVSLQAPEGGQKLWMIGMRQEELEDSARIFSSSGIVEEPERPSEGPWAPRGVEVLKTIIGVRGLYTFQGVSGAPIIDQNGTVLALEKGELTYPDGTRMGIVTPILNARRLAVRPVR